MARFLKRVLASELGERAVHVISAMDIIGDIAIIKVPRELEDKKALIGEALLRHLKHVKAVYRQLGAVSGEYRIRALEHIAGERRTLTLHREYGCSYYVDVQAAFFSPRLAAERDRVASLVREGERVLNMFAGVGPFSILIAKRRPSVKVYSIEANPSAYELLTRNIRLNKVEGRVVALLGDAARIVPSLALTFDRVLMPYPEASYGFIDVALAAARPGAYLHYYRFGRNPESVLQELGPGRPLAVERWRRVREIGPRLYEFVLDLRRIQG
ncbi:MAG: methyltransferase [Nitrososphaerota archaeon]